MQNLNNMLSNEIRMKMNMLRKADNPELGIRIEFRHFSPTLIYLACGSLNVLFMAKILHVMSFRPASART